MKREVPPTFTLRFFKIDTTTYQLKTSQILPISPERVFIFFEDPGNLYDITPKWLDFRMVNIDDLRESYEGVVFDLTIRWFGFKFKWRSKIIEYRPPDRFTDIQIKGPYTYWQHLHIFEKVPEGTLMKDEVTYRLPFGLLGKLLHSLIIKRQLEDIFCYRAWWVKRFIFLYNM